MAENVSGMLANRHSDAVKEILRLFDEAGYSVTLNLVNAKITESQKIGSAFFTLDSGRTLTLNLSFQRDLRPMTQKS